MYLWDSLFSLQVSPNSFFNGSFLLYYPDLLLFQETMGKVYHIWILWWCFIYIFKSSNVLLTECAVVLFLNWKAMIFFLSTLPSFFNNFSLSLYILFFHCQAFFLYWRAEIILKISLDIILKPGHLLQRMWINHHFDFPHHSLTFSLFFELFVTSFFLRTISNYNIDIMT